MFSRVFACKTRDQGSEGQGPRERGSKRLRDCGTAGTDGGRTPLLLNGRVLGEDYRGWSERFVAVFGVGSPFVGTGTWSVSRGLR